MLRRILLVVMAAVTSFALTACSGYILYTISEGRSEGHLSLMIRFIFNPAIAVLVGVVVGLLSRDHPVLTTIVGLAPWVLMSRAGGALLRRVHPESRTVGSEDEGGAALLVVFEKCQLGQRERLHTADGCSDPRSW
jgi:hypothetical protein